MSSDTPSYELSPIQKRFVKAAEKQGLDVYYTYSGRFMFGRQCPAVNCGAGQFGFKGASQDQMGKGIVVYMP